MGKTGRGTHEHRDVMGRVDIITDTFGKALGGASGGFVAGPQEMIELLRQRSRPYLFSNTLPPVVGGARPARCSTCSRRRPSCATSSSATSASSASDDRGGLRHPPGRSPDRPDHVRSSDDAPLAQEFARTPARGRHLRDRLLLPGRARGPGAHPRAADRPGTRASTFEKAVEAFTKVGKELKVIA